MRDASFRNELHSILGGCAKRLDCQPVRVGGVEEHLHLLTVLSRTVAISEFVKEVKRNSTGWAKEREGMPDLAWQAGYGCFSVSESQVELVSRYLEKQEEHHRKRTFQDEYRELCVAMGRSGMSGMSRIDPLDGAPLQDATPLVLGDLWAIVTQGRLRQPWAE